jgi:hypothetical protein
MTMQRKCQVELTLVARLDVFVKPLGRLRERGNPMGLALPHANHGNNQEYKGCEPEKESAQRAVGNRFYHTEERINDEKGDVESQSL